MPILSVCFRSFPTQTHNYNNYYTSYGKTMFNISSYLSANMSAIYTFSE